MIVMGLDVSVRATGIAVIGFKHDLPIPTPAYVKSSNLRTTPLPWHVERVGYSLGNDAGFDELHARLEHIATRVQQITTAVKPDLIAIEEVVFANEGNAKAQIWGMNILIQHAAWKIGVPVKMVQLSEWRAWYGVASQTVRKRNPKASKYEISRIIKEQVRDRVRERFGVDFEASEHNEAEAFAIAHYARHRALNPDAVQQNLGIQAKIGRKR